MDKLPFPVLCNITCLVHVFSLLFCLLACASEMPPERHVCMGDLKSVALFQKVLETESWGPVGRDRLPEMAG